MSNDAKNSTGVPASLTGEKLSLEQRKDFVSTAIKLFQTNQKISENPQKIVRVVFWMPSGLLWGSQG